MHAEPTGGRRRIPTFCALCVSRCGAIAIVEDGRFVALHPDPAHPTGQALCAKGKAAPELVAHPGRLQYPLKRTRPKGDPDPGWQRIGWDEALDTTAARLRQLARDHGAESVVFSCASPSTSALSDSIEWVQRLRRAFGSPNFSVSMELCGWGRYLAPVYTFGAPVPGAYMPDLDQAGCILFWGYNPSVARLVHATAATAALGRGARLIVVDPRRAGLARKADHWLRVRPGTDAALALALAGVMIERGWFDREFVRDWTNGPLLVRDDTKRFLRESDLAPSGSAEKYVGWDERQRIPLVYDAARGAFEPDDARPALEIAVEVVTKDGRVGCRTAFARLVEVCRRHAAPAMETVTGVPAAEVERAAHTLWTSRPVAYYAWSGVEQQSDATQIARAIGVLYALTGSLDRPGGNVLFQAVAAHPIGGEELLPAAQREKALGLSERPLGAARWEFVTSGDVYTAVLEGRPYRVRGLVGFGSNLLVAHADGRRGREALRALDFYVHADLFLTPTAALADIVLPVATPFETTALRVGFEVSAAAQRWVQLRQAIVPPCGEARADLDIVFQLASRLGLGDRFWNGDVGAAWRHQLAPSGLTLDALGAAPRGLSVPLDTRHRKFADAVDGVPRGFRTPSRRIELYSETLLEHGYAPLPEFREPPMSPRARPDLAAAYPLVLTSAKSTWFCESQHRALPSLRRHAPDPEVELHPDTARTRGIGAGDWVHVVTPHGRVRARARLNRDLHPDVVCGQHGWWQACPEIGAPGYDAFGADSASLNLILRHEPADPISASAPLRAYVCDVRRMD
jgi:anaerobic selenocysteine-containing dehydrogenase